MKVTLTCLINEHASLTFFTFLKTISLFSRSFFQNIRSLCISPLIYQGVLVYQAGQSKSKGIKEILRRIWLISAKNLLVINSTHTQLIIVTDNCSKLLILFFQSMFYCNLFQTSFCLVSCLVCKGLSEGGKKIRMFLF